MIWPTLSINIHLGQMRKTLPTMETPEQILFLCLCEGNKGSISSIAPLPNGSGLYIYIESSD